MGIREPTSLLAPWEEQEEKYSHHHGYKMRVSRSWQFWEPVTPIFRMLPGAHTSYGSSIGQQLCMSHRDRGSVSYDLYIAGA